MKELNKQIWKLELELKLLHSSKTALLRERRRKKISKEDYEFLSRVRNKEETRNEYRKQVEEKLLKAKEKQREKREKLRYTDERKAGVIFAGVMLLMLSLITVSNYEGITGFATFTKEETFTQTINQTFTENGVIELDITNATSLRISGEILGRGRAKVILDINGTLFTVLDKTTLSAEPSNLITGMVSGGEEIVIEENITESIIENTTEVEENVTEPIVENITDIVNNTIPIINITPEINITIDENITENVTEELNITINATENITLNITPEINVSLNVTENITDIINITPEENITINATENITLNITPEINITLNITENISTNITEDLNISINITENITIDSNINITPEENITINATENITLNITPEINITLNITENITEIFLFADECVETCLLDIPSVRMIIEVEGTVLTIESLTYKKEIENNPPVQTKAIENLTFFSDYKLDASEYFREPDGQNIIYDIKSIPEIDITIEGSVINFSTNKSGVFETFIYATDGISLVKSNVFSLTVGSVENITVNKTVQYEENITQLRAEIGKPVKWIKTITLTEPVNETIVTIPEDAVNIVVTDLKTEIEVSEEKISVVKNKTKKKLDKYHEDKGIVKEKKDKKSENLITGAVIGSEEYDGFLVRWAEALAEYIRDAEITGRVINEVPEAVIENATEPVVKKNATE
ncbi:hypothetical protein ACFLTH_11200, partial [Bacteroidota bacterium]